MVAISADEFYRRDRDSRPTPVRSVSGGLASCEPDRADKVTRGEFNIPQFAAGDIASYTAKFKLIATGAAEAVSAVNHAVQ